MTSTNVVWKRTFLILALCLVAGKSAYAGHLRIDQIDADRFPDLTVYATLLNQQEQPVTDVQPSSWSLLEDGATSRARLNAVPFKFSREGVHLAVVLMASGVMKGQPLENEKKAVLHLASKLSPHDQMTILAYGDRVETVSSANDKKEDRRIKIRKMNTFGDEVTLYDALWQALETLSKSTVQRKAILVITDGRNSGIILTKAELQQRIKKSNIPIYAIGYTLLSGSYLPQIKSIAESSGGAYLFAAKESLLSQNVLNILNQIQKGFVIKFRSRGIQGDGQMHQLTLKNTLGGKEVVGTKGFLAIAKPLTFWQKVLRIVLIVLAASLIILALVWFLTAPVPGYKRRCPACKRVMKDDWDECLFCKYTPYYSKDVLKTKR